MSKKKSGKRPSNPVAPSKPAPIVPVPQPMVPEAPQSLRHFFTPEDWIAAAITFLIAGFTFLYYMSPEVTLQDSGELVTGAFNFGVPHPPGYPLWAFLGWMWRHLVPIGNPAYRICLMSVLTGALVVGVLTLLMTRSIIMLLRSMTWAQELEDSMKHWIALTIGATSALLFGFNRGVWLWACVPEMRVLNVFMFIVTACTFFAWMMRPQRHGFLYATILVYGLGISNHQTIMVMAVPFVLGAVVLEFLDAGTENNFSAYRNAFFQALKWDWIPAVGGLVMMLLLFEFGADLGTTGEANHGVEWLRDQFVKVALAWWVVSCGLGVLTRVSRYKVGFELVVAMLLSAAAWTFVMSWAGMKMLKEFVPVPLLGTLPLEAVAVLMTVFGACSLGYAWVRQRTSSDQGMAIRKVLFSFNGRISRTDYWYRGCIPLLIVSMLNGVLVYSVATAGAVVFAKVIWLFSLWPALALAVKRLHDRNRSGWFLATVLVPIVEIWCLQGTPGPNRFGSDPHRARSSVMLVDEWRALLCAIAFLLGVGFYAYMPVASSTNPPMNWGYSYTKQGFLHHITRGQYERLNVASPLSEEFFIQIRLFAHALIRQYTTGLGLCGLATLGVLIGMWKGMKERARSWLIFVWLAFLTTSFGLLTIINPQLDKQNQEINQKFFAPAHGFFAMMIGYGLALGAAWVLVRWREFPRLVIRVACVGLLALPLIPFNRNWRICEQRNHDFGYQFGYRMFYPGGDYPPMDRDAVLYGGTDPGRFVPTYMIFCESRASERDRYRDPYLDPVGGAKFDRRDVYIITQNALADSTYMSYIRDHYDYTRPDPYNPATLERRLPWQRKLFRWGWKHLYRDSMYPKEPIWIPSEMDTQRAFQEYVDGVQARQARGETLSADEQISVVGGQVSVRGVAGVMNINGILTKWIFDHNKDKHSFYVEESYVINWMYPYLTPAGIIMKINRDELPSPEQNPKLWGEIITRDKAYWNKLCEELKARPEFQRDTDAQKTFSKLRSAIGGVYANRRLMGEAEYAYRQALELCRDSPEGNFRLAQLYMELGQPDKALEVLEELRKLDPLNDKVKGAVQQIRTVSQSRQEIQRLEAARASNSRDFGLLTQLAQAHARAGQIQRIDPLIQSYLAQTNLPADDILQAAQIYVNINQIDASMRTLQIMIQRYPQDARSYFAIAMVRAAQNNAAEAMPMLAKAIELAPNLRAQTLTDPRFANLRENPEFRRLMNAP